MNYAAKKTVTSINNDLNLHENASPPAEVARVILEAVTSSNPESRYLTSSNAFALIDTRRNTSDREFEKNDNDKESTPIMLKKSMRTT